ncbi:MAG: TPM domain-containing protein [Acidobacteriota bacterium]
MRFLAGALCLAAATAAALEVPPTPTRYLTDLAGVVPTAQAREIDETLAAIETRTGHQVIAVIFPSLEGEPLEDFTMRCAEAWKVGRKGLDDGIIFFAFVKDRRMRLEVGYGLEDKVPDAIASRLLAGTVKPAFQSGDYGGGILALAAGLERIFRGEPPPTPRRQRQPSSSNVGGLFVLIIVALLLRIMQGPRGRGGGRGGGIWWGGLGGLGGGGWGGGGLGGGGFSGGGGSFGGGGASGSW